MDRQQDVFITTYCPFNPGSGSGAAIEGGHYDRKGRLLHTVEDHQADPDAHPYVSLAGDYTVFNYGQRLILDDVLGVPSPEWTARTGEVSYVARVVDTGGHFHGPEMTPAESEAYDAAGNRAKPRKVIRHDGDEPIDVCVAYCNSKSVRTGHRSSLVVDEGAVKDVLNLLGLVDVTPRDALAPALAVAAGLLALGVVAYFATRGQHV